MAVLEIQNAADAVTLRFKMDGPVFDDGIPVHIMVDALGHVQGIMDKAYLGLVDRRRITKDDRARFYLQSQQVVRSSLLTDLGVVFTGFQTVLPFFGAMGPTGVWEYAKETFTFLKLMFEAVRSKQRASYSWSGDRSVFHVNTGSQTQTFNGPVFNIAQMSIHHYQGLAQHLEVNRVTDIQLGREARREVSISLSERELLQFPSRVEEAPHRVRCEIFDFNKFDNVGKLHIFEGQTVPDGDYRFQVIGEQDQSTYIEAMLRQAVSISCLQEISENPISGDRVVRIQVIKVEP